MELWNAFVYIKATSFTGTQSCLFICVLSTAAMAELSSFYRECGSAALYRKSLPTPALYIHKLLFFIINIPNILTIYLQYGARRLIEFMLVLLNSVVSPTKIFHLSRSTWIRQHCVKPAVKLPRKRPSAHLVARLSDAPELRLIIEDLHHTQWRGMHPFAVKLLFFFNYEEIKILSSWLFWK